MYFPESDNVSIRRRKKNINMSEVNTLYRILLANRSMTTDLLEELTGAPVVARSRNRLRLGAVVRTAVLSGNGRVFVFARSVINIRLLPGPAVRDLFRGSVPLGRIFARYAPMHSREKFSCFTVQAGELAEFILRGLELGIPDADCMESLAGPGADDESSVRQDYHRRDNRCPEFPGRSYVITSNGCRLARIEEFFSPQILATACPPMQPGKVLCALPG